MTRKGKGLAGADGEALSTKQRFDSRELTSPQQAGQGHSTDEAERIERIAVAFLFTMISEEKYISGCRELFQTGDWMDQRRVVDAVVKRLQALDPPHIDPLQIRVRVWRDLIWRRDLRNLKTRGRA